MANYPMPGQTEFSADQEKAMRVSNAAQKASSPRAWSYTPKGLAIMSGANIGTNLPDDATDKQ